MKSKKIGIRFKSQAYRMLKAMPGKLWFVFAEFVDNSISSYLQNREKLEMLHGSDFKLIIELDFDDHDKITISDNAAGIDARNWERALNPGDVPDDVTGLNEFGMGMKYSAVWLSDIWTLKSRSIDESHGREVTFDYNRVISENLEELEYKDVKMTHGTVLTLRKLEKSRIRPFQWQRIQDHIASIYRNFIRDYQPFFDEFISDGNIEIRVFNKVLKYKEKNFLIDQWYDDRQNKLLSFVDSPKIEWKFKFSERIRDPQSNGEIKFSGFIGILPKINSRQNGFSFFRRGRVIEGSGDEKMFPKKISSNPGSFRYKRLYGEFHFDDTDIGHVESAFNKNSFQDQGFIDFCINQIPSYLKSIEFPEYPGREFNLLSQADKYSSRFDRDKAKKSIENFNKNEINKFNDISYQSQVIDQITNTKLNEITHQFEVAKLGEPIPEEWCYPLKSPNSNLEYNFILNYFESVNDSKDLYSIQRGSLKIIKSKKESIQVDISINLKHIIFIQNESFRSDQTKFALIVNIIRCLAYAECVAKDSGAKDSHYVRNSINQFINIFLNE